ncbi:MAG TPA: ABC transporter ATP-binding protein [Chitinophagales bacterium]|nr:ABC transporter ATP-binding protein [Chitinophagales bacterium]
MNSITLNHITKTYNKGTLTAVDDVSFEVKKGEVFGLIGPDGAGKTSIFRILTTLLLADKGEATVAGLDVVKDFKEVRNVVGYMPGRFSLYQDLSIEENLNFFATVFGTSIEENYDLIKDIYVKLEPFKTRRAGKLSGGMKQKLALCCALIHKPKVLFLDEPTTGVDVVSRKEFWDILGVLKNQGISILVSTSYMDEATLCDRIALMQLGKVLSIDTPQNIIAAYPEKLYGVKSDKGVYKLLLDLRQNDMLYHCYTFGEYIHVSFKNANGEGVQALQQFLENRGHTDVIIRKETPTIEDCFINLLNVKKDGNGNTNA